MRHVDKSVFSNLHMITMNNELKILERMNKRGGAMETKDSVKKSKGGPKCFFIQKEMFDKYEVKQIREDNFKFNLNDIMKSIDNYKK